MSDLNGIQIKYVHVIYKLDCGNDGIRSIDIANELGVSKVTVHNMLKLLIDLGFVSKERYGTVKLTPKGKKAGALVHAKITDIYPFFANYLELEKSEALDSTYTFLCTFSNACIENLAKKKWGGKQENGLASERVSRSKG